MKYVASLIIVCLFAALPLAAWSADTTDKPAPIRALEKQGLDIKGSFKAPDGLTGYAASYQGSPVAVYVTPGSKHAIVGTLVDGQGNDLSTPELKRLVVNPKLQNTWGQLKDTTWVADGPDSAPRTIYMFTDPNCPFCHQFWKVARPWVKAGKVQIRHVLVGLLKPSSLPKAAAILDASDPSAALKHSEQHYEQGGIEALKNPSAKLVKEIGSNTDLMKSLGFFATPTLIYRDEDGHVSVKQGVPQGQKAMTEVMGSAKP